METTIVHCGHIGIMEKKMETTIVYWGYIGIMEKNMGVTVVVHCAIREVHLVMKNINRNLTLYMKNLRV